MQGRQAMPVSSNPVEQHMRGHATSCLKGTPMLHAPCCLNRAISRSPTAAQLTTLLLPACLQVDQPCPKCDHPEMEFYTMQLRSADEGQTVFYECPKCGHKYNQNT